MNKKEMIRSRSEGTVPLLEVSGTAHDAGIQLGYAWKEAFHHVAAAWPAGATPWWMDRRYRKLIERYVPHVPDLYRGMAKGAGVPENRCAEPAAGGTPAMPELGCGCTSFAIQPAATLDGIPISGQTKDTPVQQQFRFVVLRLKLQNAPSALTLTYPGLLFGHGFVVGGCSIFRNSMRAGEADHGLPYPIWGLLALHCPDVDEVVALTRRHGIRSASHCTVADEHGGIVGIETGRAGFAAVRPRRGIYTHANAVVSGARLRRYEEPYGQKNSFQRQTRLRDRLEPERGRLTSQWALMALCDHVRYPRSICRHESLQSLTTSAVVVEPTRRRLICTRGAPCQNWPTVYTL